MPARPAAGSMPTMPLHERDTVRHQLADCVFVGRDLTRPVPKYRFPPDGTEPAEAFQVVSDELMLDGNARQNLATFCQTWAEPEVLALMVLSVNKNMIDKDEYPQTAEIERRCVHMLADLWRAPKAANTIGASAIGSSEACMQAGMAAKWRWRARRQAEGKPADKPNMVCGPVQVVWHKFARYWDIEMREVPMSHGHYAMDPESMLPRVKSISTSGHKFGLAPLGVGWVVWRDREELPEDLVFHVNYLGGDMPVFQINFSRPAGQIIAQYYNFLRLGFQGYKGIHEASYAIGQYLAAEIAKVGPFELLCDSNPATGIPTVTWRIRDGADPGYTLFDLADRLRTRGCQVPAYTLTGTASDIAAQRILVRLGVSQDMASLLLDDFRDAVAHFSKHPVTVPMSKEETSGFNHL